MSQVMFVTLAPNTWYLLPGTNTQVMIKDGPMVNLAYVKPDDEPKKREDSAKVSQTENKNG